MSDFVPVFTEDGSALLTTCCLSCGHLCGTCDEMIYFPLPTYIGAISNAYKISVIAKFLAVEKEKPLVSTLYSPKRHHSAKEQARILLVNMDVSMMTSHRITLSNLFFSKPHYPDQHAT